MGSRIHFNSNLVDSNVWASEPPTGTGIWEMHYESLNGRGVGQPPAETSVFRDINPPNQVPPATIIGPNNSVSSQNSNQLPANLMNRLPRNWDGTESEFFKHCFTYS